MQRIAVTLIGALLTAGCALSGHYEGSGPCEGFHKDLQACERAYKNSLVIGKVKIGQSPEEVRAVMGRDHERREATAETESWGYLTNYADQLLTTISFRNGRVTELRQAHQ